LVSNICLYDYYIHFLIRTSFAIDIIGGIKKSYYCSYFFTKSMYIVNLVSVSCHRNKELKVLCEYIVQAVKVVYIIEINENLIKLPLYSVMEILIWGSHLIFISALIKMFSPTCLVPLLKSLIKTT